MKSVGAGCKPQGDPQSKKKLLHPTQRNKNTSKLSNKEVSQRGQEYQTYNLHRFPKLRNVKVEDPCITKIDLTRPGAQSCMGGISAFQTYTKFHNKYSYLPTSRINIPGQESKHTISQSLTNLRRNVHTEKKSKQVNESHTDDEIVQGNEATEGKPGIPRMTKGGRVSGAQNAFISHSLKMTPRKVPAGS